MDLHKPGNWTAEELDQYAKSLGMDNYGRMAYLMSFFPEATQAGMTPQAHVPPDTRPSYYQHGNGSNIPGKFVRYDPNDINSIADPNARNLAILSQYGGYTNNSGMTPDYANIMSALQAQGWDPSMGYGPQDWAALRAKTFGPNSMPQNADQIIKMYNDLLSVIAPTSPQAQGAPPIQPLGTPQNNAPNFQFSPDMAQYYNQGDLLKAGQAGAALNQYGSFQNGMTSPSEFYNGPDTSTVQGLINKFYGALGSPEAQAARRAYSNMTGGNNPGGVIHPLGDVYSGFNTGSAGTPGNAWQTLGAQGVGTMPQNMSTTTKNAWGGLQGSPWG